MEEKTKLTIITVIAIGFLLLSQQQKNTEQTNTPNNKESEITWQKSYAEQATKELLDYQETTSNTEYYDINHDTITNIANKILKESKNSEEAITMALKEVDKRTSYDYGESDDKCFDLTAPQIIDSGSGQCDTQSISVISILRKMGIAAKPVGGCLLRNQNSCLLQSIFTTGPNTKTLTDQDLEQEVIGRAASGGLHAWVIAWTPEKGWITLEPTTGTIANTDCYDYHIELFPENNKKNDICVTRNIGYAQACKEGNNQLLNLFGKGYDIEEALS